MAGSVPIRVAANVSVIDNLHNDADNLSSLDSQLDRDGNLDVALSFSTEAEMVLFKLRVS
jgi:uncharacterized protein YfcZ (UPF0381/DUF406 family)